MAYIFRCHVSFKDGNSPLPLKKSCLANKPFLLSCSLCSGAGWLIFGTFSPNPLGQKHALKQVKYSISGGSFIFPKVQGKKFTNILLMEEILHLPFSLPWSRMAVRGRSPVTLPDPFSKTTGNSCNATSITCWRSVPCAKLVRSPCPSWKSPDGQLLTWRGAKDLSATACRHWSK